MFIHNRTLSQLFLMFVLLQSGWISAQSAVMRVNLAVNGNCKKHVSDLDPLGLTNNNYYSDCKSNELNQVRGWIAGGLAAHGIQVVDGTSGGQYQYVVTITKDMEKVTSFPMKGTWMFEASYQVMNAAGQNLATGNVAQQGPDNRQQETEQQFAQKIAEGLSSAPVGTPSNPLPASLPGSGIQPAAQPFTSIEGHFKVDFPGGAPQQKSEAIRVNGGGNTTIYKFWTDLENDKIVYMVMYNDYDPESKFGKHDTQWMMARLRNDAINGKTLLTENDTSLNGVPGHAITAKDDNWNYSIRLYLKGKRLYQLIVVSSNEYSATQAEQFFNSFSIFYELPR